MTTTNKRLVYFEEADPTPFAELFDECKPFHKGIELGPNDYLYYGGGTDVDPTLYGEDIGLFTQSPDTQRDLLERGAFRTYRDKIGGFIGVCRGAQFLTVMSGGKLVQHITGHGMDHFISTEALPRINVRQSLFVTSTHHQMMFPWNLPPEDYHLIGWSTIKWSQAYLDGNNEKIDIAKIPSFCELEIAWYPKTKALCIQGHPEYKHPSEEFPTYSRKLIQHYLFGNQ